MATMSDYEARAWAALKGYWDKRANRRTMPEMPPWLSEAGHGVKQVADKAGRKLLEATPERVKDIAERVAEATVMPAIKGATHLLELVSEWSAELMDPDAVVRLAQKHGHDVNAISDLRQLDLQACDRLLGRTTLRWRTVGALEGASIGALASLPVPIVGSVVALSADVLVIHVMSTAIATRVAYSYGIDARDPSEEEFIQRIVTRSFLAQGAKAKAMNEANLASHAVKGRQRWSNKLRNDQKLVAALEKFMKRWYANGRVPIKHVGKALPIVSVLIASGMNSHLLGQVASDAQRYCQTRFLAEKYSRPLPSPLRDDFDLV